MITDAENGLFSRFIFYYMRTKLEWQDVFQESADGTLDEYFQGLGEEFRDFYVVLKTSGEMKFRLTPQQGKAFNLWFENVQRDFAAKYGDELIASVRRMGLITFRMAMILTTLRVMEHGAFDAELWCLDEDFNSAMKIAQVLIEHTAKVFRELPKVATGNGSQKTIRKQAFWEKLPDEFDRKTFVDVSAGLGIPLSTAERSVKKWCEEGLVERVDQGKYRKK